MTATAQSETTAVRVDPALLRSLEGDLVAAFREAGKPR